MTPSPQAEWLLPTACIGQRTLLFDQVDSTNTLAASLASEPGTHGLALLAQEQTAGRGQHGRTWSAPAGSSVLLSVILHPPAELRRPVLLTAWAAVSVCAVVQDLTGWAPRIKWPNDVLLRQAKVCGILIEQGRATVVGIGLNVGQSAEFFAQAGLPTATSLVQQGAVIRTVEVARRLLLELDSGWSALERGELDPLESQWKGHLGLLGQRVMVEGAGSSRTGRLREVGFDGLLLDEPGETGVPPCLIPCEQVRQVGRIPD